MREQGAEDRVDERRPHQIAGNGKVDAGDMQRCRVREPPQNDNERKQRDDRGEQPDANIQSLLDETPDIVGDALVRVVGRIALELHLVVGRAIEPFAQIVTRQPLSPANLEPLIEIELVDGERHAGAREQGEDAKFPNEAVPVALLEVVVEAAVPLVHQHVDGDQQQFDHDHRGKQAAAGPFVLRPEIRDGDSPDDRERGADVLHRAGSPRGMCIMPRAK